MSWSPHTFPNATEAENYREFEAKLWIVETGLCTIVLAVLGSMFVWAFRRMNRMNDRVTEVAATLQSGLQDVVDTREDVRQVVEVAAKVQAGLRAVIDATDDTRAELQAELQLVRDSTTAVQSGLQAAVHDTMTELQQVREATAAVQTELQAVVDANDDAMFSWPTQAPDPTPSATTPTPSPAESPTPPSAPPRSPASRVTKKAQVSALPAWKFTRKT